MSNTPTEKFILFREYTWNYPVTVVIGQKKEAEERRLVFEQRMMQQTGILNLLASRGCGKHKPIVDYLKKTLNEVIEFKMHGHPYILADYELQHKLSVQHVKDILDILEYGLYKVIPVAESWSGKYLITLSEAYQLEDETGDVEDFICSNLERAEMDLSKYLVNQMYSYRPEFARILESKSKTDEFELFINDLRYFYLNSNSLFIQPTDELMDHFNEYKRRDWQLVKKELDLILKVNYAEVYEIVQL